MDDITAGPSTINRKSRILQKSVDRMREDMEIDSKKKEKQLAAMQGSISFVYDTVVNDTEQIKGSIGSVNTKVDQMEQRMNNHHQQIHRDLDGVRRNVSQVNDRINGVDTKVDQVQQNMNNHHRQVHHHLTGVRRDIGHVNDRIDGVQSSVGDMHADMRNGLQHMDRSFSAVQDGVNNLDRRMKETQYGIDKLFDRQAVIVAAMKEGGRPCASLQSMWYIFFFLMEMNPFAPHVFVGKSKPVHSRRSYKHLRAPRLPRG